MAQNSNDRVNCSKGAFTECATTTTVNEESAFRDKTQLSTRILIEEILNEKKLALMKSPQVLKYLREHLN